MKKILIVCFCTIFVAGCEIGEPPPPPPSLNANPVWYTKEITKRRILSSILSNTNDVSDTIKQKTYGLYDVVDIEDIASAYKQDAIYAKRRFEDKKILTSGKVFHKELNLPDPVLIISSERSKEKSKTNLPANLLGARFEGKNKASFENIYEGQRVTLACEIKIVSSHPVGFCEMLDDLIERKEGAVDTLVNSILNGKSSWDEAFDLQTKRVYSIASKMPLDSVCFRAPDTPECRKDYKRAQAVYEKETGDKDGSADLKEPVSGASGSQSEDQNGKKSGAKIRANICAHFIADNIHKMAMTQFGYKAESFSVSETDIYPDAPNIFSEVEGLKLEDKHGKWHDVKFQCFVNRQTNEVFDVFLSLGADRDLFLTDAQLQEEKQQQKLIYMVNPVFAKPETSWAFTHPDAAPPIESSPVTNGVGNQQAKACYKQVIKHLTPSPKAQKQWVVLSENINETEATFVAQRRGHTINVGWSKGMGSEAIQICSVRETNADGVEVFNDEGSDLASESSPVFFK